MGRPMLPNRSCGGTPNRLAPRQRYNLTVRPVATALTPPRRHCGGAHDPAFRLMPLVELISCFPILVVAMAPARLRYRTTLAQPGRTYSTSVRFYGLKNVCFLRLPGMRTERRFPCLRVGSRPRATGTGDQQRRLYRCLALICCDIRLTEKNVDDHRCDSNAADAAQGLLRGGAQIVVRNLADFTI